MDEELTQKDRALLQRCTGAALNGLDEDGLLALIRDLRRQRRRVLEGMGGDPAQLVRAARLEEALARVAARLSAAAADSAAQLGGDGGGHADGASGLPLGVWWDRAAGVSARIRHALPVVGQRQP
jgi:hypothetical protein